ncbi:hypothetical protein [Bradyrhizobium sp. Rc3b]|uniref:hypothetical protein n=1 Tax=Bradyrhizobium sp. Rc3b TaxID=1855322 RepID=UPI000B838F3D|nr:hypothetical protein [Bradyrhizobium sp. Rc3b]
MEDRAREIVGVAEMLDDLIATGCSAHEASRRLAGAIESGKIILKDKRGNGLTDITPTLRILYDLFPMADLTPSSFKGLRTMRWRIATAV